MSAIIIVHMRVMFAWTNQLMHRWVTMKGYCQSAASVILPGVMIYLRGASLSEQHTFIVQSRICHSQVDMLISLHQRDSQVLHTYANSQGSYATYA